MTNLIKCQMSAVISPSFITFIVFILHKTGNFFYFIIARQQIGYLLLTKRNPQVKFCVAYFCCLETFQAHIRQGVSKRKQK